MVKYVVENIAKRVTGMSHGHCARLVIGKGLGEKCNECQLQNSFSAISNYEEFSVIYLN